jgi:transposase
MERFFIFCYDGDMRPHGTQAELERRRRHAIELLKQGKASLSEVARWVGASKSSVCRWYQTYQKGGSKALRSKQIPGRPPKLSAGQKVKLEQVLLDGPLASGYRTDLWTLRRIAQVIQKRFGIQYHPNHVWRLLLRMGWSCQKPERRALQRNEDEIGHWKRYRWPHIKKGRKTWGPSGLSG